MSAGMRHPGKAGVHGRAAWNWPGFARALRAAIARDGRAYRPLAEAAGVTITDLSRAAGGGNVGVDKVFALCRFMARDPADFYRPPKGRSARSRAGKIGQASHVSAGETGEKS